MVPIETGPTARPPEHPRPSRRDVVNFLIAAVFSLAMALSTPLSGIGAQMAYADAGMQVSIDVVEDTSGIATPDPASDDTGSLDPPAGDGLGSSGQATDDGDETVEGSIEALPSEPPSDAQPAQSSTSTDMAVEEDSATAQPGQAQITVTQDGERDNAQTVSAIRATIGSYAAGMGVSYATLTLSGLTGPATLTVEVDGTAVPNSKVTRAVYDEAKGGWFAEVDIDVQADGSYDLEEVQPEGIESVRISQGGTEAKLLDRAAIEGQLAAIPSTHSYANLGTITIGNGGDYWQPDFGRTDGGMEWSYAWKTWNGYITQCVTPTASAGYQYTRDTSVWASDQAVSFYEYVASRASQADALGVPATDPGRQAIRELASKISTNGDQVFAAEHMVLAAAMRLQMAHGPNVFDSYAADDARNAGWLWTATCDSMAGVNYEQGQVFIGLSNSLNYNASTPLVEQAFYTLYQQYSSQGYTKLMNGISSQAWIGFHNGDASYHAGYQHVVGYKMSGRLVTATQLTVSKESAYSNGGWTPLTSSTTWRLVSVVDGAEGTAYDQTLSSQNGSATVTFTGVPNSMQFRLYEVQAPSGYTAREAIDICTDGTGGWNMWNQQTQSWDDSTWSSASAGKTVYTGVTGSGSSTTLHVMDAPTPPQNGRVELYKVSAKPEFTSGNASYSLQGAEYGVYADSGCTQLEATIATGADGHGVSGDLRAGTYWVKEVKASPGYAKDENSYKVNVVAGQTTRVGGAGGTLKEQPQNDPLGLKVYKVDSANGQKAPQGDASLEGARITVRYYAGQYSDVSSLPSKATRTWVLKTDGDGYAVLNAAYKVSGDDFYYVDGKITMPLGTVAIQETGAPRGYNVNQQVFLRNIAANGDALEPVSVDMTFQIPESVQMGGLSVQKAASGPLPAGATLEGVQFQVFNGSAQAVTVGGVSYAPATAQSIADGSAKPILTMTTDKDGYAATAKDALPFGTYIVHESYVPVSTCTVRTAPDQTVQVREANTVTPCGSSFVNEVAKAGLSVQKLDAQTADGSAQGSASLAGARFEVRDASGSVVLALASDASGRYQTGPDALTLGTYTVTETAAPSGYGMPEDRAGRTQTVTLSTPGEVVALQAPFRDPVLRGGLSVQKADVETGATDPQGGASFEGAVFEVYSANSQQVVVNGVSYGQDDKVAELTTDASGSASTAADALPVGTYKVRETQAPKGYQVNGTEWTVTVQAGKLTAVGSAAETLSSDEGAAADPLEALVSLFAPSTANAAEADGTEGAGGEASAQAAGSSVAEQVVRGGVRVHKVDADTGQGSAQGDATLEGTEFTIATLNANPVVVGGKTYTRGSDVMKIYTDKDGIAQTGERDLPYGAYSVRETSAPIGYYDVGQIFEVTRDGVIVELGQDFENDVKRGGISVQKVDADLSAAQAQGSATLAGTVFQVTNASAEKVVMDGVYYDPGEVVATLVTDEAGFASTGANDLPYGTYTVREVDPPSGYLAGEEGYEQTVVLREGGVTVACGADFANDVKRGGISLHKADAESAGGLAQGAATLQGAEFNVYNANEQPVVVDGKTYAQGDVVMTLTTDGDGNASTGARDLPVGTYTVREVKAPEGYDPDPEAQDVTVVDDGATVACGHNFNDKVVRGGFGLRKADSETGAAKAQGDATLGGAAFEVVNANGQNVVYEGREYEPGQVVATVETDATGWAQVPAGSLPYGKYTVTEAASPDGYHVGDADGAHKSITVTVDSKGWWHSFEANEIADRVVRGGISLHKVDADTMTGDAQGEATLEGTTFEIANASEVAVVVNGESFEPGEAVMTLTTDASGFASTGERDLPYGTYTVREVKAPEGYDEGDGTVQVVEVREEAQVVECGQAFANSVMRGGFGLRKADSETGAAKAQGDATLAGARFTVTSENDQNVVVDGESYSKGDVVMTITTDEDGWAQVPAKSLPYGTYTVAEASSPDGYHVGEADDEGNPTGEGTSFTVQITGQGWWRSFEDGEMSDQVVRGGLSLHKADAQTADGAAQGAGTLGGAVFEVVNASKADVVVDGKGYGNGEVVLELTTDERGDAATGERALPYGTYTVREKTPPEGYAKDSGEQTVVVRSEGEVVACGGSFNDQVLRGGASVGKLDSETGLAQAQGSASLQGAVFEVSSDNDQIVIVNGQGYMKGSVVARITTDASGYGETGKNVLPYGTYKVRETVAPKGYLVNKTVWTITVSEAGQVVAIGDDSGDPNPGRQQDAGDEGTGGTGAVVVGDETADDNATAMDNGSKTVSGDNSNKTDAPDSENTGENSPSDQAEAAGEQANSASKPKQSQGPLEALASLVTPATANASEADRGTFAIEESPLDKDMVEVPHDRDDGTDDAGNQDGNMGAASDSNGGNDTDEDPAGEAGPSGAVVPESVVRGDLELVKVRESDMGRLAGVPFLVTSLTTGEAHVVVTDADGRIDTAANPHSSNTNANDAAYDFASGAVDDGLLDASAGTWFSGSAEGGAAPDDSRGALPYDEYSLEELPCAANAGLRMVSLQFTVQRDSVKVDLGTVADRAAPSLATELTGADGAHGLYAQGEATLTDTVWYDHFDPGDYTATMELVLDDGTPLLGADGQPVTAQASLTAEGESGQFQVTAAFDCSALAGRSVTAFETVRDAEGNEVASHRDLADKGQTVAFYGMPSIGTTLAGKDGTKAVASKDGKVTLVDTVSYSGLIPGLAHTLSGALMNSATGEPVTDAQGNPVTASVEFIPNASDGTADVVFELDYVLVMGNSVVAFETLRTGDLELASHRDLSDQGQTVSFDRPAIRTTLTGSETGLHEVGATSKVALTDTVAYEGVKAGATYELTGTLMDKSTGEALVSKGQKVEAAARFTAEAASGTATVEFSFDASDLGGRKVVAYEVLSHDGQEVARHEDMDDADQTVSLVRVRTTATDASDGDHEVGAAAKATLADRVEVWGLEAGATYTIETELADASTKETVASSSASVTPSKPDTAFTVKAEVDTTKYAGRDLVFLETVKRDGKVVAEHRDYSDAGQTIHVSTPPANPTPETPSSSVPQTGEKPTWEPFAAMGGACMLLGLSILFKRRLDVSGQRKSR